MNRRLPIAAALLIGAIVPPMLLAMAQGEPPGTDRTRRQPIDPMPMPELSAVYRHALFAAPERLSDPAIDQPDLVGVIGRIGRDAVAIVRQGDGGTRTLGLGDSIDGWRLEALSADAAAFRRGNRQVRVAVPGSAPPPPDQ